MDQVNSAIPSKTGIGGWGVEQTELWCLVHLSLCLPGGLCFSKEQEVHVHPSQNFWATWLQKPTVSLKE